MIGRRRGYRRGRGFGGGGGLGMMLLAMQLVGLFQYLSRSNDYCPITLGVLGLNVIAFFQPGRNWPSISEACISVRGVWFDRQWKRLFLASFYHTSDFHLYYNMSSFIWKAISLEKHFGSGYFLYMIAVFSVCTNLLYVAINYALAETLNQWSYITSCAAGFSGVLFALKVVTTHLQPAAMTRVMGFIPVPMRLACWVELFLISVLFPNVSFIGHLSGILVGLAFIYGPLQILMDAPLSFFTDLVPNNAPGTGHRNATDGRSYTYRAGTTGHGTESRRERSGQERSQQRAQPTPNIQTYQSYTYASGVTGRRVQSEDSEEEEIREAIQRSLSEREGGGQETQTSPDSELGDVSDPDLQVALERSLLQGGEVPTAPPPPYNPNFVPPHHEATPTTDTIPPSHSSSSSLSSSHGLSHSDSVHVGWRQDLLDANSNNTSSSHPLEPDIQDIAVQASENLASGSEGTVLRQRSSHQSRADHAREVNTGASTSEGTRVNAPLSLSREEVRAARLQRLGVLQQQERDKTPLSELSRNSRRT